MSEIPKEFGVALKKAGLSEFFADCTNAHRREYLKWITEAKRPETRQQRIEKSLRMLAAKRAEESRSARQ
jgi:uncharacterized protein YdeI (YjbR/CyaY-like superfamily)